MKNSDEIDMEEQANIVRKEVCWIDNKSSKDQEEDEDVPDININEINQGQLAAKTKELKFTVLKRAFNIFIQFK